MQASAKARADLCPNQPVDNHVQDEFMGQEPPALIALCAEPDGRHEQLFRHAALGADTAHDAVVKNLVKPWHGGHQCR